VAGSISATADRELVVTRVIDAPRRLVFRAWTQPEHIARWWGPQGYTTIHCEMDIRVGGAYRFGMRSPQGTEHWKRGVYREIVEPERLVFTWGWANEQWQPISAETIVRVTFENLGGKTKLTLRHGQFESVSACELHRAGWLDSVARLEESLAAAR